MNSVRRSITLIAAASAVSVVVTFLSGLVVARLLQPYEIGLYSMAAVFIGVMHTLRDFGVVSYLVREPNLTPAKIRTATGVLFQTSWLISLLLWNIASPLSSFYGHPQIKEIVRVLAIGFVFIPFGSVTQALLRRDLQAGKQAAINLSGAVVYAVACIILAAGGASYMSMAWANLIGILFTSCCYVSLRPDYQPWLPSLRNWRTVAAFGGISAFGNLLTNVHRSIPDALLGKFFGAHSVGLFSRANGIVDLLGQSIMPAVENPSLPALSSRHNSGDSIDRDMIRSAVYLSGIGWPILVTVMIFARDVVLVLYGHNWISCVQVVPLLCLGAAARAPFLLTTSALVAIGRPTLSVWTTGVALSSKLVLYVLLKPMNLVGFVGLIAAVEIVILPMVLAVWRVQFGTRLLPLCSDLSRSAILTVCIGALSASISIAASGMSSFARLFIALAVIPACWAALTILLCHPLGKETKNILSRIGRHST